MENSNHSDSDSRDKGAAEGLPDAPMRRTFEFTSALDLTTGAQIEIQDEATSPPNEDELIVFYGSMQHQSNSPQWSQNETLNLGIQDRLLPCLQDLLEFPISSNCGDTSIQSNERIHFDGSEFDVPSVLELEDAGIAAFSEQEEEFGLGGTLEILGTPSYHIYYNDEQNQLFSPNPSNEQGISWMIGSGILNPYPNSSQDGDVDSESQSEIEYAGNRPNGGIAGVKTTVQLDEDKVEADLGSSFIRSKRLRRTRFLKSWKVLQAKVSLINARTRTTSNLEAILDNERFTMPKQRSRNESSGIKSNDAVADTSDGNESDDDHRYAAVILTQKVSSQLVRDHQYNFKTSKASEPSETDQADEVSTVSSLSSKPVFLKLRYARERQLVSFLKSIFSKIDNLKALTGATILLTLAYENHVFDGSNYKEADALLRNKRRYDYAVSAVPTFTPSNELSVKKSNAPYAIVVDKDPVEEDDRPGVHIRFVIQAKPRDTINKRNPKSVSKTLKKPKISKPRPSSSTVSTDSETQKISSLHPHLLPVRRSVEILDHMYGKMDSMETDVDDLDNSASELTTQSGPPSESASVSMMPDLPVENFKPTSTSSSDTASTCSVSSTIQTYSNFPNSTRDAGTCTEPVCIVCSSNYPPSTSKAITPTENFWIRCYDPFCQQMVHPSCIGFRITSSKCLKMLPPYFCKDHRSD